MSALPARRFTSPRLSGCWMDIVPRTSRDNETDLRPLGTNGRLDHPRCHPTSALPRSPDRRDGGSVRSALPAIAGALRRSLLAPALPARSVRRLPGPFTARRHPGLPPTAGSLCWRATGTRPVHSPPLQLRRSLRGRSGNGQAPGVARVRGSDPSAARRAASSATSAPAGGRAPLVRTAAHSARPARSPARACRQDASSGTSTTSGSVRPSRTSRR